MVEMDGSKIFTLTYPVKEVVFEGFPTFAKSFQGNELLLLCHWSWGWKRKEKKRKENLTREE